MGGIKDTVLQLIKLCVEKHTCVKINLELFGFYKLPGQNLRDLKSFITRSEVVNEGVDLNNLYNSLSNVIDARSSEFNENNSGR
jgi:hypothetical protein